MGYDRHRRNKPQGDSLTPNAELATKGLESPRNWTYIAAVFAKSSSEAIERLLDEAHYRPPNESRISQEAKERAVQQQLAQWVQSAEGQAQLDELKRQCLAAEVAKDADVFEAACRNEIQRQVDRWLASPGGQEAIEQTRQRAIRRTAESAVK